MIFPAQGGRITSIGGMNRTVPVNISHFGKKKSSKKKSSKKKSSKKKSSKKKYSNTNKKFKCSK